MRYSFCLKTINLTLIIMKTTTFANRHIGIGEEELPLMLQKNWSKQSG